LSEAIQIVDCRLEQPNVIAQIADSDVACIAEQATHDLCAVDMIDVQLLDAPVSHPYFDFSTDCALALLLCEHFEVSLDRDAVLLLEMVFPNIGDACVRHATLRQCARLSGSALALLRREISGALPSFLIEALPTSAVLADTNDALVVPVLADEFNDTSLSKASVVALLLNQAISFALFRAAFRVLLTSALAPAFRAHAVACSDNALIVTVGTKVLVFHLISVTQRMSNHNLAGAMHKRG
jgi:hypothetical protein